MDLTLIIFTRILVLVISSLGLIGNFLCLLVLFRKEMKCSYNYILLGLTFSDILLLIISSLRTLGSMGQINLNYYYLGIFLFIWDWICTGGTKYYTVAISMERYYVVCFPLQAHRWITNRRAKMFAISVSIFVFALALVSYVYNYHLKSPDSFEIYAAVVLHFSPFIAVLVLNLLTYRGLMEFQSRRKNLTASEVSEVSVTRMLLAIVLVFGICYSFEFTRRIMNYAGYFDFENYQYYDYAITNLADIFYVLNSSVNFIIYCLLGKKFRTEFMKIVWSAISSCGFINADSSYWNINSSGKGDISNKSSQSQESKESNLETFGK